MRIIAMLLLVSSLAFTSCAQFGGKGCCKGKDHKSCELKGKKECCKDKKNCDLKKEECKDGKCEMKQDKSCCGGEELPPKTPVKPAPKKK